ncbi:MULTISPECIES: alternate-type signal peptide domain-containing protein [unclassified Arthrobacter]|uniref:alternate-type signal peptide domain-containing protein n=1 Tax=unclassified Arthrobacter TaxID=235627 RepID=UPI002157EE13|nr:MULTISPECIES: alternate-type signal peptide domain-containing protein [unclassified Arthrobacter]
MAKGALAIGVGAALLLGGGGTLAVWNAEQNSSAGTIASGDLNLEAVAGTWTSNIVGGIQPTAIATYKMVPGEKLTFTQKVNVTLTGTNLSANLAVTGGKGTNGTGLEAFETANIAVSDVVLTKDSKAVANPLKTSVSGIDATVTFEFLGTTTGRDDTNAKYNLGAVGYSLVQNAPTVKAP